MMADPPRHVAIVRTMDDLHDALRRRADELKMSRATIDAISGLQSGYAAKLLAPQPIKNVGKTSLGPMLETLGLLIWVMEDVEALERIQKRSDSEQRNESQVRVLAAGRHEAVIIKITRRELRKRARSGGRARARLSAHKLSQIGRKGARARWQREALKQTITRKRKGGPKCPTSDTPESAQTAKTSAPSKSN